MDYSQLEKAIQNSVRQFEDKKTQSLFAALYMSEKYHCEVLYGQDYYWNRVFEREFDVLGDEPTQHKLERVYLVGELLRDVDVAKQYAQFSTRVVAKQDM